MSETAGLEGTPPPGTPPAGDPPPGGTPPVTEGAPAGEPASGTPPADTFAAERDRLETQRRALQSERDRLAARVRQLEDGQAAPVRPAEGEETPLTRTDLDTFRREMLRDSLRATELVRTVEALRQQYPNADSGIFERAVEYDSIDALRLDVIDSHQAMQTRIEARVAEREAALREEFEQRYGQGNTPPGAPPAGSDPTPEQLARMSNKEWEELERRSPGVVERVLRSAQ